MCYEAAKKANKKFFAIQFFGECWVSDTESYKLHGPSTNCWNGVGRDYDNYVYEVLWWTAQVIIKNNTAQGNESSDHFNCFVTLSNCSQT